MRYNKTVYIKNLERAKVYSYKLKWTIENIKGTRVDSRLK